MQTRVMMQNTSGIILDAMESVVAFHTKQILDLFYKTSYNNYNKTRFVVERFFAWLKNGFHRTRIRYERIADNYLGFVYLASIMMYWRILG